jgi:hypothetical protein
LGWSSVSKRDWKNTVYIIGGGSSLTGFNFQQLQGRIVLVINDAMLRLPWATAVFSADRTWASKRSKELAQFNGERYLATGTLEPDIPEITHLMRDNDPGLSEHPQFLRVRGTSGYGALNLAFLKGAPQIVLLGFDYYAPQQRWYKNYSWPSDTMPSDFQDWAKEFDSMIPQLKRSRVEVWNANPESRITAFPTITLKEIL